MEIRRTPCLRVPWSHLFPQLLCTHGLWVFNPRKPLGFHGKETFSRSMTEVNSKAVLSVFEAMQKLKARTMCLCRSRPPARPPGSAPAFVPPQKGPGRFHRRRHLGETAQVI